MRWDIGKNFNLNNEFIQFLACSSGIMYARRHLSAWPRRSPYPLPNLNEPLGPHRESHSCCGAAFRLPLTRYHCRYVQQVQSSLSKSFRLSLAHNSHLVLPVGYSFNQPSTTKFQQQARPPCLRPALPSFHYDNDAVSYLLALWLSALSLVRLVLGPAFCPAAKHHANSAFLDTGKSCHAYAGGSPTFSHQLRVFSLTHNSYRLRFVLSHTHGAWVLW